MSKDIHMHEALCLVENFTNYGSHEVDEALLEALEPGYVTEEEELILSYFDAYFGSENHETYLEESDYIDAICALDDVVLTEEAEELNELLGMIRQAVGGAAKKMLGRGNEINRLRATGNTGLGKATFTKKHLPTAVAAGRGVVAGARGAVQTGQQLATGVKMAARGAKDRVKNKVANIRNKVERRKAAKALYTARGALKNQAAVKASGNVAAIAKNAGQRKAGASVIAQRARGALGGSASAARQVDRARRGESNIGLKVRKTAVQRRPAAAAPVSAGVAGASRKLRRTLYGNQRKAVRSRRF
jgi:hypothetical protein